MQFIAARRIIALSSGGYTRKEQTVKIVYIPKEESKLIGDMGKALQFMHDFCGCMEKCRECDFKNACYNLSKLSGEFVSIGDAEMQVNIKLEDLIM